MTVLHELCVSRSAGRYETLNSRVNTISTCPTARTIAIGAMAKPVTQHADPQPDKVPTYMEPRQEVNASDSRCLPLIVMVGSPRQDDERQTHHPNDAVIV